VRRIRNFIAWICLISGGMAGLYSGIYEMIYIPVINACVLHDVGHLTSAVIAKTVFSILCAPFITVGWIVVAMILFGVIYKSESVSKDDKI
jgi:hypothetical protein